jgi:phosphoenolpyruvate---glycerone phosphotransferase subunit DhaL
VTGDGDHGTAIVQALTSAVDEAVKGKEFKSMLNNMAMNVMMQTSGSTSTLVGGFFLGMSDNSEGTELSCEQVRQMFRGGLEGVQKQTGAREGDKTMMDALIPAIEALLEPGPDDIGRCFALAAEAAQRGAEATAGMIARYGRSRNYGDRSLGHADPGAASWACIFEAFNERLSTHKLKTDHG